MTTQPDVAGRSTNRRRPAMMKPYLAEVPRDEKSPDRDRVGVASPRGMGSIARIARAPAGPRPAGAAADWLCLAAAPSFAAMALLDGLGGVGGPAALLCGAGHGGAPLGGMVPMYLLMSLFHAAPWLRLLARRS
ncbi:MAG: hypothetical protein U1E53_33070 [Dongiaceae bacterium]